MKLELKKGDSPEFSDNTPMYNPQGLPLRHLADKPTVKLPFFVAPTFSHDPPMYLVLPVGI